MAIAFYVLFSSFLSYCVKQDVTYYLHKPKAPVEHKLKGKV